MSSQARRAGLASLVLGAALVALQVSSPALAEEPAARAAEPRTAERAWTDPPARAEARAEEPAKGQEAKALEAKKTPEAKKAPEAGKAPKRKSAASTRAGAPRIPAMAGPPRKLRDAPGPVRSAARARPPALAHTTPRPRAVAPAVATFSTESPAPTLRGRRVRTVYWHPAPVYGQVYEPRYAYVTRPGGFMRADESYAAMRAARIRQAQEAGYLVVRARSVEFPDGRRLRTYRPFETDEADE